ncbi:unnamed protein product [Notodromas monacha]|uniref:Uncharacterized protein n=1 Tax=Notodromas monacha TaxID=399045 RepID=A0A7R9BEM5_9CRUS|nr:unnamed protein product [Notodromas monacha]CAG0912385.1 unnamed protein product [Notodromas monacha]
MGTPFRSFRASIDSSAETNVCCSRNRLVLGHAGGKRERERKNQDELANTSTRGAGSGGGWESPGSEQVIPAREHDVGGKLKGCFGAFPGVTRALLSFVYGDVERIREYGNTGAPCRDVEASACTSRKKRMVEYNPLQIAESKFEKASLAEDGVEEAERALSKVRVTFYESQRPLVVSSPDPPSANFRNLDDPNKSCHSAAEHPIMVVGDLRDGAGFSDPMT